MNLDLAGQRVLVLGLGISGQAAARFCAGRGARVVAADERGPDALGDLSAVAAVASVGPAATGCTTGGAPRQITRPLSGVKIRPCSSNRCHASDCRKASNVASSPARGPWLDKPGAETPC